MSELREKLEGIYGIGPVKADDIITKGIDGVRLDPKKPVRQQLKRPKIYKELPANTRADLKYNPSRRVPHWIMRDIDKYLQQRLRGTRFDMAGSYRRGKPYSRDIDIIIRHKGFKDESELDKLIDKINGSVDKQKKKKVEIVHVFACGPDKAGTILRYCGTDPKTGQTKRMNIKVDFFAASADNYVFMLLFGTGSGQFNVRMRAVAKHKGYLLNQHGLFERSTGKKIPISTERQLFKRLNIKYLDPKDRKV